MAAIIATEDPSFDILYTTAAFGYTLQFGPRLFLPIDDHAGDTTDFLDGSLKGLTSADGVQRALPLYDNPNVWGWNKRLFEAIGEDPDNPPDTYEALFALVPKFRAKGIIPCAQPWLATAVESVRAAVLDADLQLDGPSDVQRRPDPGAFDGDDGLLTFETIEAGIRSGWWDASYMNLANDNDAYRLFGDGNVATVMEAYGLVLDGDMAQFGAEPWRPPVPGDHAGDDGLGRRPRRHRRQQVLEERGCGVELDAGGLQRRRGEGGSAHRAGTTRSPARR